MGKIKNIKFIKKFWIVFPFIFLTISCLGYVFAPNDPFYTDITNRLASPSVKYPLGTDILGRCILSRLLYGGKTTVGIVLLGCFFVTVMGTTVGLLISKSNNKNGIFFESILNAVTAIPPIAYLIIFIAAWGNGIFTMIISITVSLLLRLIKLVKTRAEIELDKAYVYCAITSGSGRLRVLFWHIFPNIISDVAEFICLSCADMILAIVGFSFIGLGLGDNVIDWGTMVLESYNLILSNPVLTFYPIACIFLCTLCFQMLGRSISKGGGYYA